MSPAVHDLPPGYAQSALKLIRELERLSAEQTKTEAAPATGPPATLALSDLSILLSQPKEKTPAPEPVVERMSARAPPAAPPRVAAKPVAERPAPPVITARLAPATPKDVEAKPEPPAAEAAPQKPAGLIERIKLTWDRIKKTPN